LGFLPLTTCLDKGIVPFDFGDNGGLANVRAHAKETAGDRRRDVGAPVVDLSVAR
jgi:hypothetical protein